MPSHKSRPTEIEGITALVDDSGNPILDPKTQQPRYRVRVYDAGNKRQIERWVAGFADAKAVRDGLLKVVKAPVEARRAAGLVPPVVTEKVPANSVTVATYAPIFLEHYKMKADGTEKAFTTWNGTRQKLDSYILPYWGEHPMASITLKQMLSWLRALKRVDGRKMSGSTKEGIANTVRVLWKDALLEGEVIDVNPMKDLPSSWGGTSGSPRRAVIPSIGEVEALAEAMDAAKQGMGDVVRLIAYTGARWSEADGIMLDDINWQERSIALRRAITYSGGKPTFNATMKTRAADRLVPIVDDLEEPLRRLIAQGEKRRAMRGNWDGPRWLLTGNTAEPMHYRVWRDYLRKGQQASGVTYTAHVLRHVAASLAIFSGMTDFEVSRMMGHTSVNFTKNIYGHLMSRNQTDVAFKLSEAIAAQRAAESRARRPNLQAVNDDK